MSSPKGWPEHSFEVFWVPVQGRELDSEEHVCRECGLSVEEPRDLWPLSPDEGGSAVEPFTPSWYQLMSLPATCDLQVALSVMES